MMQSLSCQIELRGLLDPSWTGSLDGLALDPSPEGTVLTCTVRDQAALHGLLALLRDTGITIVSITVRSTAKEA